MVKYLDDIIKLRGQRRSYSEIGEMLGITRAWVSDLLLEHRPDLAGREISESRPELEIPVEEPDELLSLKSSAKLSRVSSLRIVRDQKKTKDGGVNLSVRRRVLAKKLFNGKIPGPCFPEFLKEELFSKLETEHQTKIFENFYLLPVDESVKEEPNKDTDRAYRSYVICEVFPEIVKSFNIKDLLSRKVLRNARKQRTGNPESNGSQSSDSMGS